MTKFNKIGKSTVAIAILSFLLVAVLTFGGTYAYFSAKTESVGGSVTMGTLYVDLTDGTNVLTGTSALGTFSNALPGQEILKKTYTVDMTKTKTSTISAFIRVKITAELDEDLMNDGKTAFEGNDGGDATITPAKVFTISSSSDNWFYNESDGYTYYVNSKVGALNAYVLRLTDSAELPVSIILNKDIGDNGSAFFMGANGTFEIQVEAIQADYLDSSDAEEGANVPYTVAQIAAKWETVVDKDYTATPSN